MLERRQNGEEDMAGDGIDNARAAGPIPAKRSCAGCDLCCTFVAVESLDKAAGVRCPHLRGEPGASCSIYDRRPDECRRYMCLWRMFDDLLPDWIAPAAAGFVISAQGSFEKGRLVFTVHADTTRPDAWMAARNVKVFKKLARQFNSFVVAGQAGLPRHVFAPSGKEFTREQHPEMFDNAGKVRFPNSELLPETRQDDDKDPTNA
jgi:hypothetical protein